ncbi:KxYKxGKxW signal peptide domain-containing protein [Niabella beijingensis]
MGRYKSGKRWCAGCRHLSRLFD